MAVKDAFVFTPYSEEELEAKVKTWFREVVKEIEERQEAIPESSLDEKPMTISEVCQFFGKSRPTIYDWMKKGILKYYKVSSRTYFLRKDLFEALKSFEGTRRARR